MNTACYSLRDFRILSFTLKRNKNITHNTHLNSKLKIAKFEVYQSNSGHETISKISGRSKNTKRKVKINKQNQSLS